MQFILMFFSEGFLKVYVVVLYLYRSEVGFLLNVPSIMSTNNYLLHWIENSLKYAHRG